MTSKIHPELRAAARWLPRGVGAPWMVRLMRWLPVPAAKIPPALSLTERAVSEGHPAKVRVFRPRVDDGRLRPAFLYIHGGGYVLGQAKQDDAMCVRFAEALDCVVVSVDYRLAPAHSFPAPVEDCFAAYEFLLREAAALGVDPARVAIGGQSAGGGLAAALALLIHDRKLPAPVLQLLIYPMIDDRTVVRDASFDERDLRVWDRVSNRFGWTSYLGVAPGSADVSAYAAPARHEDLRGLPPAWIGVGSCDLFVDEDVAYAKRLEAAGVPVSLDVVEGGFHGFDVIVGSKPVSRRFFASQVDALRRAFT